MSLKNDFNPDILADYFSADNLPYIEALFENYSGDPQSVTDHWKQTFDDIVSDAQLTPKQSPRPQEPASVQKQAEVAQPSEPPLSSQPADSSLASRLTDSPTEKNYEPASTAAEPAQPFPDDTDPTNRSTSEDNWIKLERTQLQSTELISGYRHYGYLAAQIDPLKLMNNTPPPELQLQHYSLREHQMNTLIQASNTYFGFYKDMTTVKELHSTLQHTYCGTLGIECMHLSNFDERNWLLERLESCHGKPEFEKDEQMHILRCMVAAENLEKHLDTKFPGTKRFSLEGGESLIPSLDALIQKAKKLGANEIVLGMPHRGRLNVLVNILGKKAKDLFDEFEGKKNFGTSGDVKYHQGFSSNLNTDFGELHLALAFNPSHLEIVSPVVCGSVRARQDRREDTNYSQVVPIVVHGDASFSGQGVVMETFQMSQTRAYKIGGTIHIVINNQIGFTTSRADDARSTQFCTEIAKMVQAPIFHVNGDDPEMVVFVSKLAMEYRYLFNKDVVIDLLCFRKRGHNETDEPAATQPIMYKAIKEHSGSLAVYIKKLLDTKAIDQEQMQQIKDEYRDALDRGDSVVAKLIMNPDPSQFFDWSPYLGHDWNTPANTKFSLNKLKKIAVKLSSIPKDITSQKQVKAIYSDRLKMARGELELNWGMAEMLAYGTLLEQGYPVRFSGQDSKRGTFSHRHSVVLDQNTGEGWEPLKTIDPNGKIDIYDSLLSEEATLAFEFGYASTKPDGLVIWEAQFGDFANGAQVVIDQFIASAEHKWSRLCGLTMLLPHGYEGQGPEHSSARLERFLQLCADHNIQICLPTTPCQIFHLLRRQALRPMRRPLVVMSPKWLLRHKLATSSIKELATQQFKTVIDDCVDPSKVSRLVLCAGKIYYNLLEYRNKLNISDIALVRIEQLYPFPENELLNIMSNYNSLNSIIWCQEEPLNQGAWYNCQHRLHRVLAKSNIPLRVNVVARKATAAPSCGYMSAHLDEQEVLMHSVFDLSGSEATKAPLAPL